MLEDNDPAGYKSSRATAAKVDLGIATLDLPKRSADLNVLDYSLWHDINRHMREQERTCKKTDRESQSTYLVRLRKTALTLPRLVVVKTVRDMRRRTLKLQAHHGALLKE